MSLLRTSARLVVLLGLPSALLLVGSACTFENSEDSEDTADETEDTVPLPEEGCVEGGAESLGPALAANGLQSGSLSGIRCSPSTCLCTGLFDGGSATGTWRVWWDAEFRTDGGPTDGNVGVLSASCTPSDDTCSFQLDFDGGTYYADTTVRFVDGSIDDAERASTYVSMTEIACSGNTYSCTGDLASGPANVAVWDASVEKR